MPCVSKNHIAALIFNLLISVPLLLTTGLQGWQLILKHQWKERLEREAAQTIVVPAATAVWEKQGKELVVNGKLFDVVSYHIQGASLMATGVFDEQETRLQAFLAAQHSRSKQSLSIVQLLFVLQCFAVFIRWLFQFNSVVLPRNFVLHVLDNHANPLQRISTPPPRAHFYSCF